MVGNFKGQTHLDATALALRQSAVRCTAIRVGGRACKRRIRAFWLSALALAILASCTRARPPTAAPAQTDAPASVLADEPPQPPHAANVIGSRAIAYIGPGWPPAEVPSSRMAARAQVRVEQDGSVCLAVLWLQPDGPQPRGEVYHWADGRLTLLAALPESQADANDLRWASGAGERYLAVGDVTFHLTEGRADVIPSPSGVAVLALGHRDGRLAMLGYRSNAKPQLVALRLDDGAWRVDAEAALPEFDEAGPMPTAVSERVRTWVHAVHQVHAAFSGEVARFWWMTTRVASQRNDDTVGYVGSVHLAGTMTQRGAAFDKPILAPLPKEVPKDVQLVDLAIVGTEPRLLGLHEGRPEVAVLVARGGAWEVLPPALQPHLETEPLRALQVIATEVPRLAIQGRDNLHVGEFAAAGWHEEAAALASEEYRYNDADWLTAAAVGPDGALWVVSTLVPAADGNGTEPQSHQAHDDRVVLSRLANGHWQTVVSLVMPVP